MAHAAGEAAPLPWSVYLAVRRHDPMLPVVRLRKRTLTSLSHALEDEIGARCAHPVLFGGFQHQRFLVDPLPRWRELAASARACVVFAAVGADPLDTDPVVVLDLPESAPMREEWAVVADDDRFGVVLSAWEIPGQEHTRNPDRSFEVAWSVEPRPTREAARTCAAMAARAGLAGAGALADELAAPPSRSDDVRSLAEVVARVLAYVDGGPPA